MRKDMSAATANRPHPGDVVVYKSTTPAETYVLSIFQHASQLSFCRRDEAMRDAVAFATRDHVDAWYAEEGQAYESMARRRRSTARAVRG
jgi:hypothetical protein